MKTDKKIIFYLIEEYSNKACEIDLFLSLIALLAFLFSIVNIFIFDMPTLMVLIAFYRKIYIIGVIEKHFK